ncbi:MAG: hypothetical protein ABFE08_20955 [Armatimonadia bacterium]
MHPDAERLFALDEALRHEADEVLAVSGIGSILGELGYHAVGSYAMRTMVWRDLDFELEAEPDWDVFWSTCSRFAATGWCIRLQCTNVYRENWADAGLYCGMRVAAPDCGKPTPNGDAEVWKFDVWTARAAEFEEQAGERRRLWQSLLTDEARSYILAIKQAIWQDPNYGKTLISVHVYEAVMEQGIRDLDSFYKWWRETYGPGSEVFR